MEGKTKLNYYTMKDNIHIRQQDMSTLPKMVPTAIYLSLFYFTSVFLAGMFFGSLRTILLQPYLGVRYAELMEMPIMLVVVWQSAQLTLWQLEEEHKAKRMPWGWVCRLYGIKKEKERKKGETQSRVVNRNFNLERDHFMKFQLRDHLLLAAKIVTHVQNNVLKFR